MNIENSNIRKIIEEFISEYGVAPIMGGSGEESAEAVAEQQMPQTPVDAGSGFPDANVVDRRFQQGQDEAEATGRTFTAEDLEKARREEREKLYNRVEQEKSERQKMEERIEQMQKEFESIQQSREEAREQEAVEVQRQQEEQERQQEEEMDLKALLQKKDEEWNEKFRALEEERQRQEALLQKEREYSALNEFKQKAIAENQEEIAPQFMDYIVGDSEEEIQASIERARQKTAEIMEEFQTAQQRQRQQAPGARVTAPAMGPAEGMEGQRNFSVEDISKMSMSEYAKYRNQLQDAAKQGGLYG